MKKIIAIVIVVFLVLIAAALVQSGTPKNAAYASSAGAAGSAIPKWKNTQVLNLPQNPLYNFITYTSTYQSCAGTAPGTDNVPFREMQRVLVENTVPVKAVEGTRIAAIEILGMGTTEVPRTMATAAEGQHVKGAKSGTFTFALEKTLVIDIIKAKQGGLYLRTENGDFSVSGRKLANALILMFNDMYVKWDMPEIYSDADKLNYLACHNDDNFGYYLIDGSLSKTGSSGGYWNQPEKILPTIVSKNKLPDVFAEWEPEDGLYCVITDGTGAQVFDGTYAEAQNGFEMKELEVYYIKLTAHYNNAYFAGDGYYFYNVKYDSTEMEISFSGGAYPGEALIIEFENPGNLPVKVTSPFTHTPRFFPAEDGKTTGFLPITYHVVPGSYTIKITVGGYTKEYVHTVAYKDFQVQHLTVNAQTSEQTLYSQQANDEFERIIAPLRTRVSYNQYWEGKFILPVDSSAKITTGFGAIRYTNGSTTSSRHGGVDLALPEGTPVHAANSGRVLYAGYLQLTGNTILIEHGMGVKTWYYHMSALNVETDQMVTKGELIGAIGTTGFSSGPHLHFAMSIDGAFINPYTAIQTELFDKSFI